MNKPAYIRIRHLRHKYGSCQVQGTGPHSDGVQVPEHSDQSDQYPGMQSASSGQSHVGAIVDVVVVNEAAVVAHENTPRAITSVVR